MDQGRSQAALTGEDDDPHSVGDILDRLNAAGARDGRIRVSDMVEALGHRSCGPFLLVPALLEISPLGAIPGVPTAFAVVVILFAVQMVAGRRHLWLPSFIRRRTLPHDRLCKVTRALRPAATHLDRWFHGRLPGLTGDRSGRIAAVACIVLALAVPPLELLPVASAIPMAAIAMFGLALVARDGVLMIVAWMAALLALAVGAGLLIR